MRNRMRLNIYGCCDDAPETSCGYLATPGLGLEGVLEEATCRGSRN